MENELGGNKAAAWVASRKLPTRADPVTHSTATFEIEYAVPAEWQSSTTADLESWTLKVTTEADKEDLDLMEILRQHTASTEFGVLASGGQAASGSGGDVSGDSGQVAIKVEAEVQVKQERQELAKQVLVFQDQIIQVAKIAAAAQLEEQVKKYSGPVMSDMESHKTRLNKAAAILKKVYLRANYSYCDRGAEAVD